MCQPSLIYFKTGNPFFYELDENLGEMAGFLSLQRYLIRNTQIEALEITQEMFDHDGQSGPEFSIGGEDFSDYALALEGLFWAPKEPDSEAVSKEFICALDELTFAGQRVYEIDFENAKELYKSSYLKNYLSKKQLYWISENDDELLDLRKDWNDEVIKQQIDLQIKENEKGLTVEESMLKMGFALDDDDEHILPGAPNQLGLFSWIFGSVKGGHSHSLQLIKNVCNTEDFIIDEDYGSRNAKSRMVTHFELTRIGYPTLNTVDNKLSLWLRNSKAKLDNDRDLYIQASKLAAADNGKRYNPESKYNELRVQSLKKELLAGKLVEDETLKAIQETLIREEQSVKNGD